MPRGAAIGSRLPVVAEKCAELGARIVGIDLEDMVRERMRERNEETS
jgi:hypothetical protein